MPSLEGKVALVTGGSIGLGQAIAKRFAEEGAQVFVTGRRKVELDRATAEIGRGAQALVGDVTIVSDIEAMVDAVRRSAGRLDILVPNAGYLEPQPIAEATEANFDAHFGVNVRGVFFTVSRALPLMGSGGSIILIASTAAEKGFPGMSAYGGTKAAVRQFVKCWSNELIGSGIRVNALSPGGFDTPMLDVLAETPEDRAAVREQWGAFAPIKRLGRPEELAAAALFLASDESSYVTGTNLTVDGGVLSM